ncbi:MAG TPA: tRNA preQ1(34) S-adenosylmethionine ribosyltransferase-isomerase QueA [Fimbriimonas sp.]|nr:tRNA preQ1(34) S-adenosylmethionine ribosyltransferase-isomerase QueA [Fimbriimonas sp.]
MVRLSDFDYDLPEELIAQTPLADRSASRLLHLDPLTGAIVHRKFVDLVDMLNPGDVLVLNDSRVNACRLLGQRPTGGQVEVLALREVEPLVFECLVKPSKRLKPGARVEFGLGLFAEVLGDAHEGTRLVRFMGPGDVRVLMHEVGKMPLPPYIHTHLDDAERYQTVVAQHAGSAAAPTAGLHFTPEILANLKSKGVLVETVTLHVGIDTFRPIQVDDISQHVMHGEECEISPSTAASINGATGRVIAVGTTAVRTLESFASSGAARVDAGRKSTQIFISPGYKFKVIDGMLTNFHFPKTTMMLMISALASREFVLAAYEAAVREKYRFLSFGDSMALLKS